MGLEANIENTVVRRAEQQGFYVRKVKWIGRRAAPDRIFSRADRGPVWIEFKAPDEKPDYLQMQEHADMRAAGMEVHVCDSVDQAMQVLGLRPPRFG